jgi:hypothetical protein
MSDRAYRGEDFCLIHGFNHMRVQWGHPIAYCDECEREQSAPETATPGENISVEWDPEYGPQLVVKKDDT